MSTPKLIRKPKANGAVGQHVVTTAVGVTKPMIQQEPVVPEGCILAEGGAVLKESEHQEWIWVDCDRRGFEGVRVEINVHFVPGEVDHLPPALVQSQPQRSVRHVEGWPNDEWEQPFGGAGPTSFIAWVALIATNLAAKQWVNDPKFLTG